MFSDNFPDKSDIVEGRRHQERKLCFVREKGEECESLNGC